MQEEKQSFKQAFTYLYFLMLSADKIADLSELELGNKIIKLEKLDKEEVMKDLDMLSAMPREKVYELGIKHMKSAGREIQLKCLGYLRLMAKADGFVNEKESKLLFDIGEKELHIAMDEIFVVEERLQKAIERIKS